MLEIDVEFTRQDFQLVATLKLDQKLTGLFGPSGAGKSTLLGLVSGLILPTRGRIVLDGDCLVDRAQGINQPAHQRRVGMVFQEGRLFPHLSVLDNLLYGFRLLAAQERRFGVTQIVELLEIGHLLTQKPQQLSGGEKQRVALGRALLSAPRLLLLDEPMVSLDVRLKQQILHFLARVKAEIDIPMIYVSHAIDEVLFLTQALLVMADGHIVNSGDYTELVKQAPVRQLLHPPTLQAILHQKMTI